MLMMQNLQRIINALLHKPVDRIPVTGFLTSVTVELMERCGYGWEEAHYDAEKLVELAATAHNHCGLETLKLPFDMAVEAEALGCKIDPGSRDTLPQVINHIYEEPDELVFDRQLLTCGRIPVVLKAIGKAKTRYDGEAAVVSSIVGPFTLGTRLFGMDNFLIWSIAEPAKAHAAMERLTRLCIMYAGEQAEAGCDVVLIGEAASSGDLISPDTYRDVILPYHRELCRSLQAPSVVHICGDITGHLPYFPETGMTAISFDGKTDVKKATRLLKGKTALVGYIDTMTTLLHSTPEAVYQSAIDCIQSGVDLLCAGCAWPAHIPTDNILAMIKAAHENGKTTSVYENDKATSVYENGKTILK